MLYSAQLQGNFVSRIDMKIPALFAPAAQECDGFRILPQHSATFAFGFHVVDDALEIDRYEFFHGPTITPIKPSRQQPRRLSTNLTMCENTSALSVGKILCTCNEDIAHFQTISTLTAKMFCEKYNNIRLASTTCHKRGTFSNNLVSKKLVPSAACRLLLPSIDSQSSMRVIRRSAIHGGA